MWQRIDYSTFIGEHETQKTCFFDDSTINMDNKLLNSLDANNGGKDCVILYRDEAEIIQKIINAANEAGYKRGKHEKTSNSL